MAEQFYFVFSSGQYSDYGIGAICVCDHRVDEVEWHAHYRAYQEKLDAKRERLGDRLYEDDNWKRLERWKERNDPETTFQKLHNMKKLEVLELWRDA